MYYGPGLRKGHQVNRTGNQALAPSRGRDFYAVRKRSPTEDWHQ